MKEIENPSIPSHPPLSITDRNAREGISLGKTFPIREHGSRTGRVQGPRANEKIEHSLRGPMLRIFGYRAPSPPIVDLISSRERTREREREPGPELPRVSLIHQDRVRGREDPPSPYTPRFN